MILNLEKLRKEYKLFRKKDKEIAARINILIELSKLELKRNGFVSTKADSSKRIHIVKFLDAVNVTERTIQRWKISYRERGPEGLGKLKATGRPPVSIRPRILRVIEAYRKMFRWGSEVIQAHLKLDHSYEVSRHKIEKYLDDSDLRNKYPCTTKKRQRAEKKKKHTKFVVVENPGDHTQMDVKYQTHLLVNKSKCYVYNFMDHASNWSFKYAYSAINARNTKDFMERLIVEFPFVIYRLQTDNGVEFTNKYLSISDDPKMHLLDIFCDQYNIKHKLIPPGEKELQGLVERSHRQDDQELFSRINPFELKEFNKILKVYTDDRNRKRRFKKLMWRTPNEWLENYFVANPDILLNYNPLNVGRGQISRISAEVENSDKNKNSQEAETSQDFIQNDVNKDKLAA